MAKIAAFLVDALGVTFRSFNFFNYDPPRGVRPYLVHGTAPWHTHDAPPHATAAAAGAAAAAATLIQAKRRGRAARKAQGEKGRRDSSRR